MSRLDSGLLIFDWFINLDLFTPLTRSASFLIKKHGRIPKELRDIAFSIQTKLQHTSCKISTKYAKTKLVRYYDPPPEKYVRS